MVEIKMKKKKSVNSIIEFFFAETSGCSKDCKCNDCDSKQKILLNRPGSTVRRTCKLTAWFMYQFYISRESSGIMMNIEIWKCLKLNYLFIIVDMCEYIIYKVCTITLQKDLHNI